MSRLVPLHELLVCERQPDAPTWHDGRRWISWAEFLALVARYASAYAQRSERRWLLVSASPMDFAARLLALLHAGKHCVIPPNIQPGTLQSLLPAYDAVADNPPAVDATILEALDAATATIDLYTSGSTGAPRAVRKSLRQLEAELSALESHWGERLGRCGVIGTAPHHHLYGLTFRVLWPLAAGRPADDLTCARPELMAERLQVFSGGLLVSTPAHLARWPALVSLRDLPTKPSLVLSSGGPLAPVAAASWTAGLGAAPTEIYGSSETGVIAWRCQDQDEHWTPLQVVAIAMDARGALCVTSPFVEGDGNCCTDDAVELQADGRFRLKGRLDRTVKIEEKRLYLPDMEDRLMQHPWVDSAAVVALQRARQSVGVVAVLTAQGRNRLAVQGKRCVTEALRQHLLQCFDRVLLPRHWRYPMQLPFNERGKLTPADLRKEFEDAR